MNSFVELLEYLFTIPGVEVFKGNMICQDPIEKFFGQLWDRVYSTLRLSMKYRKLFPLVLSISVSSNTARTR